MPKLSAGLLPFRVSGDRVLEVFIAHPGGPFWAKKDNGAWSIAKGEYESGDDPMKAARREFVEEIGSQPPAGATVDLGEIRQPSGKRISVWAINAPTFEPGAIVSNDFEVEWPPRSGRTERFPEVDRAEWMPISVARQKLIKGQVEFLDRLSVAVVEMASEPSASGDTCGQISMS